jgi:hypothetical protein
MAPRQAAAQDACVSELRRLNQWELANQANRTSRICVFMLNQINVETGYATLYRSCGEGMNGEIEAHRHEKSAAGLRTALASMSCGKNGDVDVDAAMRQSAKRSGLGNLFGN